MKAIWNGKVIAESDKTVVVEGNHYFPAGSANQEYLEKSETNTVCGWKGTANYYTINVEGEKNVDAAWYYPEAKEEAKNIENYIAFWKGVEITD
ncbi:MAG: DUF427 domain-containing protein [Acidobacteria bacterium]|nr:DUF427 domain-containing protein [Acidobacteriota bacterium]